MAKAKELTSSTRAFGMSDFKVNIPQSDGRYESHYNENYFVAKPDIWVHSLQRTDDIIIIGNAAVFDRMAIAPMVIYRHI